MSENNILNKVNDILFNLKDKKGEKYDSNIHKYLEDKISNNIDLVRNIIKNIYQALDKKNFNYDYKNNEDYFKEMLKDDKLVNYYLSSFNDNSIGLERSQVKTLISLREILNSNNDNYNLIPINGGPGSGKSTLLNYLISNILFDDFLQKFDLYKKSKPNASVSIYSFITNNYQQCTFLLTGPTKVSVSNISEICRFNMPKNHVWFKKDVYDKFLSRLDINLEEEKTNRSYREEFKNEFSSNLINKKKYYFLECAKKYFDNNKLLWNDIPEFLYRKINSNIEKINLINHSIFKSINGYSEDEFNELYEELKINNNLSIIIKGLEKEEDLDKKKKDIILEWTSLLQESLNSLKEIYNNKNDDNINKIIIDIEEQIINLKQTNSFKLFFKSKNSIKNKIQNIKNEFFSIIKKSNNKINLIISNIKNSINVVKEIFDDETIDEMGLDKLVNFQLTDNIKQKDITMLISSFKIMQINFNLIQNELDKKLRSENIYLFRHIQEWMFLEKYKILNKWNYSKGISFIKPIISSHVQAINMDRLDYFLNGNNKFDFCIIDEAGQMNFKYLIFLKFITNNIIAVGDEKQLEVIQSDKEINNKINEIKNELPSNEFNTVIKILVDVLKYGNYEGGRFAENGVSILSLFNKVSGIRSIINNDEKEGLYLLEHFRCPGQIFRLINTHFYESILECPVIDNFDDCNISNIVGDDVCCDQSSIIQLKYDPFNKDIEEKRNYYEIELGFSFIIDNIYTFANHKYKNVEVLNEEIDKYLKSNIAFLTLYKDQAKSIINIAKIISNSLDENIKPSNKECEIANNIISKINNKYKDDKELVINIIKDMKKGTVDSLQGIGCDFIIFSNVTNKLDSASYKTRFEFNKNRINVLWTRTKKHFIHILSNTYWNINNKSLTNDQLIRFQAESICSDDLNQLDINRIAIEINDNISDFAINKIINPNIYKDNIKPKNSEIGKYGEKIFYKILQDDFTKSIIKDKIKEETNIEIDNLSFDWLNKNKESYNEYDFHITDDNKEYYVDVKSTIKNESNKFVISSSEFDFIKKNVESYIIAKINDISKFNINLENKSSLLFAISNIFFCKFDEKDKIFKNTKDKKFIYELRNRKKNNI